MLVEEFFCRHPGRTCDETFCLISPPPWAWRVGFGYRFSLGAMLGNLGTWSLCYERPLVRTEAISVDGAFQTYGWNCAGSSGTAHSHAADKAINNKPI